MRTIRISDKVWDEIAKRGKFGETEDDVLRRVFNLPSVETSGRQTMRRTASRPRFATVRMHAAVHIDQLVVSFENGKEERWKVPDRNDKEAIRQIRDEAIQFALEQGASDPGQTNAVRKALTDAGYHLTKYAAMTRRTAIDACVSTDLQTVEN